MLPRYPTIGTPFLMHVLPSGFVRIRHDGLLANRHRQAKLARCRELLGAASQADTTPTDPTSPPRCESSVTPTRVCPCCGAGRMVVIAELPPMAQAQEISTGPAPCVAFDSS